MKPAETNQDAEIVINRIIHAPVELVFEAWSNPEHLMEWYAPTGCELSVRDMDFKPSGGFHSCIRTPSGFECWVKTDYLEIAAPNKIVMRMAAANAEGQLISSEEAGHDADWPAETILSVTLSEEPGGKTALTLHQNVSQALAQRTGAYPSWLQMLDRLEQMLENKF